MNEQLQWKKVLNRDSGSDGMFVYAVRSTGIYCRPSCPSRKPRRELVQFFPAPEQAERAGYRPCRRCRPTQASGNPRLEVVQRACGYLDEHAGEPCDLRTLGKAVGRSPFQLQRIFRQTLGITPRQYQDAKRMRQLKSELRGSRNVTESLYEVGFGSSSRLYERAPRQLGMTPSTYRRGGSGVTIRYSVVPCRLGYLLVGATEVGICAVSLGATEAELERNVRKDFPAATIARDDAGLAASLKHVLARLNGAQPHPALPLDLQATGFQRQVWEMLQTIPRGSTRSYAQIAAAIGKPRATRAVARACATNRVALLVPCHRVVRKDGEAGGYRWGAERKRAILEAERAALRG